MKEIDLKSSTIDKGLDIAKEFLDKIISPSAEEIGLLAADSIRVWRFKKQVKLLQEAKNYVEKHGLKTSQIPIKILVPLLEKASLEEEEELSKKWLALLINYIDSNKNYKSSVFPHLLNQLASNEAKFLDFMHKKSTKKYNSYHVEIGGIPGELHISSTELSNLNRLGLIRELPQDIEIFNIDIDSDGDVDDADIDYKDESFYEITELGWEFVTACTLKNHI